jgi:hypothetical protein
MNVDITKQADVYKMEFINNTESKNIFIVDNSEYSDIYLNFIFQGGVSNLSLRRAGESYNSIDMDETGQYQTVTLGGNVIYSTINYGRTWRSGSTVADWYTNTMNNDGTVQLAAIRGGGIYQSVDYGLNWTSKNSTPRGYYKMDMSKDVNDYVLAGTYLGYLYLSVDGGDNFIQKLTEQVWRSVSVSATGQYMIAGAYNEDLYISNDYGVTFNPIGIVDKWYTCSVSDTGQYMIAGVWDGSLYVSNDYGVTFTEINITNRWSDVCMSNDGNFMFATSFGLNSDGSYIYHSIDHGVSFTSGDVDSSWKGITCSSNGNVVAVINSDITYHGNLFEGFNTSVDLDEGWFKYKLYNTEENLQDANNEIKMDQCYIYNSDEPGNIIENTETYVEVKDEYTYRR